MGNALLSDFPNCVKGKVTNLSALETTAAKLRTCLQESGHIEPTTLALMLTYGDRVDYVAESAAAALNTGCANVIVISNGCASGPLQNLVALTKKDPRIVLFSLDQNYGSAGGMFLGLETIQEAGWSGDVLLLDDDNRLGGEGLDGLRDFRARASKMLDRDTGFIVACASRSGISHFRRATLTREFPNPPVGSFLTFDLATKLFGNRARKFGYGQSAESMPITMETAPYGGLLLSVQALRSGIRPDPSLILYEDDTDFTHRLIKHGFVVAMCEEVEIEDLDAKWSDYSGVLPSALVVDSPARCFFGVRNRLHFESARCSTVLSRARFVLNGAIYLSLAILKSVIEWRFPGWRPFFAAVRAGLRRSVGNSEWGKSLHLAELPEKWLAAPAVYSSGAEIQVDGR